VELTFAQRQLIANLRTFYADADAARSEGETLRSSTELAAESLRLTTLRYRAGEATVLEVVDAQNTLVLTRAAFDDAQVRYRVSLANLQTVTGSF
jgi:outer membrane protein